MMTVGTKLSISRHSREHIEIRGSSSNFEFCEYLDACQKFTA